MFPSKLRIALLFMACFAALSLPLLLAADIITIAPSADTTLFQLYPTNNLGGELTFISGITMNEQTNRALLKFDIAGHLPASATIQSVSLNLTVVASVAFSANNFTLHRVLRDWGEGRGQGTGVETRKGSDANNGDATFLARLYPNALWSAPGAAAPIDFAAAGSANQTIDGTGSYDFQSTPTLMSDVQSWFTNAASNFGWILICDDETTPGVARRFASREDSANAPSLTIEYTLPEPPHVTLIPVADTSLFELNPDFNMGATSLAAGAIGIQGEGKRSRALMRFAFSDLPTDAVLTSARLDLTVTREPGVAVESMFDLHRVLRRWGEGDKNPLRGDAASAGEATWNSPLFPSPLWSAPGGAPPVDFVAAVSASTLIAEPATYSFTNVLADVQFWIDHPNQNYGWILISENESTPYTAKRFVSRESVVDAPTLTIQYQLRPRLIINSISETQLRFSFAAQAGQGYSVQSRASLSTGAWGTFTNVRPAATTQTALITTPVSGNQRFYRVTLN